MKNYSPCTHLKREKNDKNQRSHFLVMRNKMNHSPLVYFSAGFPLRMTKEIICRNTKPSFRSHLLLGRLKNF